MESTAKPSGGKGGAPKRNRNAIRHGLTTGQLPKGCGWVATITNQLRKALEDAVAVSKGEVSLYDASLINSATRWERHAMLAQRWLRVEKGLTIDQKLTFSREVARASSERDRCLKELKLDACDTRSLIDALYATPHEPEPDEIDAHEASEATVDDDSAPAHTGVA